MTLKRNNSAAILERHCPSMNNLYLDDNGRQFRDRAVAAMEEYSAQQLSEFKSKLKTNLFKEVCGTVDTYTYDKILSLIDSLSLLGEEKQEHFCNHRFDGPSIDGIVRCHWCGEPRENSVVEKNENQEELWKMIYIDFNDGEGWINFTNRNKLLFNITRK